MSEGCVKLWSCVNLQSCVKLQGYVNIPTCVHLRGCVECNEWLILNDCVLLSGLYCTCNEVHGRDGEKIPLNLQDCLQSKFTAKQGSY